MYVYVEFCVRLLVYSFHKVEVEDVKVKKHRTGQPTGEALVVLPSARLAQKAIKEKCKQTLGKESPALSFKSL